MKFKNVKFLKSCSAVDQFPAYSYPEFAFMGRSNVGKSSLINMILGSKNLVKTGSKPGVTKTINFFLLEDKISIADLPGFGYAKLPVEIKKNFYPLIKNYINKRENLKLAFLLIDIRRIPDDYEREILSLLEENEIFGAIALTKCDKLTKNKRIQCAGDIMKSLNLSIDNLFFTSTKTGEGKKELLHLISDFI